MCEIVELFKTFSGMIGFDIQSSIYVQNRARVTLKKARKTKCKICRKPLLQGKQISIRVRVSQHDIRVSET